MSSETCPTGGDRGWCDFDGWCSPCDDLGADRAVQPYLVAALWAENMDHLDNEWSEEALKRARDDVKNFLVKIREHLDAYLADGFPIEGLGHDFWLTRNHHGAGFWDRGLPGDLGEILTSVAQKFGELNIEVGDDNRLHFL